MGTFSAGLTILKLGGSLITHKDRPLTANEKNIRQVAKAIKESCDPSEEKSGRMVIVHGGGSFGHYWAAKFGLDGNARETDPEAISLVNQAMIRLHSLVLDGLVRYGVPCKTILSSEFLGEDGASVSRHGRQQLGRVLDSELLPITYGNVHLADGRAYIVSGDAIALALVKEVKVYRVIFAMDVDGIFPTAKLKGEILPELSSKGEFQSSDRKYDVTGGVRAKVARGLEIARLGADVFYLNGSKDYGLRRLLKKGSGARATFIKGRGIARQRNELRSRR